VLVETDEPSPIRACPPGRCLEHKTCARRVRAQFQVGHVVAHQALAADLVVEQDEGGEVREIDAIEEDQRGLEPAVAQEQSACKLGQWKVRHGELLSRRACAAWRSGVVRRAGGM